LPKNVADYVSETADGLMAGYAGKLTYRQKEAIMRRTGLSPRNYAKIHLVEEQTDTLIKDMLTTDTDENIVALLTQAGENAKAIDTMTQAAGRGYEDGRISGALRRKPGFPLVSFAASGVKRIPLQSLARLVIDVFFRGSLTKTVLRKIL
jgi:hypothetical protein